MKKFLLETAKIVGTATDRAWSQVHTFSPTEDKKMRQRGQFLAVISLSELTEGVEAISAGREIISRLHEEYYGYLEEKAINQLKNALEKILTETAKEANLEIETIALIGETIYLAVAGKGKILVQRQGKVATILSGEEEKIEIASGQVQEGDMFLLGSSKFFSLLAEGAIRAALSADSAKEAAESLMPMVHGREEDGTSAAAVLRIEEVVKEAETGEEQEEKPTEKEEIKPVFGRLLIKDAIWKKFSLLSKQGLRLSQLVFFKLEKRLKGRAIYLSPEEKERKKPQRTLMTVAVILLVLLLASVVLGARQRSHRGGGSVVAILNQAEIKKKEGEALIDLNPIRARQLLLEAKTLIEGINPDQKTKAVLDFQLKLEESLSLVMREHEVEPSIFYDLALIKDGAQANDWDVSGGELIIFDKEKKSIYSLEIKSKKESILAGGEGLIDGEQISAFLPKIYLLTERGILQFDKETKRESLVIKTDEEWDKIADLKAFGGNLYLLDKQGEIWKYPGMETGFGVYRRWLKGEKPDFSDVVEISIDGSIWILKANGSILKYTQGVKDSFTISGLDKLFSNPTAIFTDDDQENLYILDKGNSRVVVISKSGEYQSQYIWQGISEITGLIASEEEKKILLFSGNKIYQIEIR